MRLAKGLALTVCLFGVMSHSARADDTSLSGSTVGGTFIVLGYVVPLAGSLVSTSVNGAHISYDEPPPRHWRVAGYVLGAIELAIGGTVLALAGDTTAGKIEGIVPLVSGVASIGTAYFAPRTDDALDISMRLEPLVAPRGAGLVWSGKF